MTAAEKYKAWRDALAAEKLEQIEGRQAKLDYLTIREQEKIGLCVRRLSIVARKRGVGGRHIFSFALSKRTCTGDPAPLPFSRISVGDVVSVGTGKVGANILASGVVHRLQSTKIQVTFDESSLREDQLDWDSPHLVIRQLADTATFGKLNWTIDQLEKENVASLRLHQLLLDESVEPLELGPDVEFYPVNKNLNQSQLSSIKFALRRNDIAVIHGPPGTGKTTTVVELIIQLVKQRKKVLVAAPSNMAVDNLIERLICYDVKSIRLGHPARVLESVRAQSLDSVLDTSDEMDIV
eukprot:gene6904-9538_t